MISIPIAKCASSAAITTFGVDIGKNTFHLLGLDDGAAIVLRHPRSRAQVGVRLANMTPCLVGMEACVGARHLGRRVEGPWPRGARKARPIRLLCARSIPTYGHPYGHSCTGKEWYCREQVQQHISVKSRWG